jgi:hypothetical protein
MEPIIMVVSIGLAILLGTDRATWEPVPPPHEGQLTS